MGDRGFDRATAVCASLDSNEFDFWGLVVPALPIYASLVIAAVMAVVVGSIPALLFAAVVVGLAFLLVEVEHVKRALLTVIVFEIPLQLDVFLSGSVAPTSSTPGFNLSLMTLCLVVLYALWVAESAAGRTALTVSFAKTVAPAGIYMVAVMLSVVVAGNPLIALFTVNVVAQALLFLIYVVHAVDKRKELIYVVVVMVLTLTVQAAVTLMQEISGIVFELGPINGQIIDGRPAGTLRHPNRLGSYAALMLGPSLGLAMSFGLPRFYRVLGAMGLATGAFCLALSASRGALLGAALSIPLAVALGYRRGWIRRKALITGGAIVVLIILMSLEGLMSRIGRGILGDSNVLGRLRLMELSLDLIVQHPILGVGANNFLIAISDVLRVDFNLPWLAAVHNKYLLVWAESGTVGLAAFVYFIGVVLHRLWRTFSLPDPILSPLALGFLSGAVALLIHMNFDRFSARPDVHVLWLYAGVALALYRLPRAVGAATGSARSVKTTLDWMNRS